MSEHTKQELRDRLAAALWENRRLVQENDAFKSKLAAAQKWVPSLEIGHGQWPLSQAMRDDVGGPEEDAAWQYLQDEAALKWAGGD